MQSISLADELTPRAARRRAPSATRSSAPGVPGRRSENLAARALRAFRAATGWQAPPLRLSIDKRIPVAAGLGGGSADAAAALRLARRRRGSATSSCCASSPRRSARTCRRRSRRGAGWRRGAGELLQRAARSAFRRSELLVLPSTAQLSTAEVYARGRPARPGARARRAASSAASSCAARWSSARRCRRRASCCTTTCRRRRVSLSPQIADALGEVRDGGRGRDARQRLRADGGRAVRPRQRPRRARQRARASGAAAPIAARSVGAASAGHAAAADARLARRRRRRRRAAGRAIDGACVTISPQRTA